MSGDRPLLFLCDRPFTREEDERHEDTLAGLRERVHRLARELNAPGLVAQMDQVDAKLRDYRDAALWDTARE